MVGGTELKHRIVLAGGPIDDFFEALVIESFNGTAQVERCPSPEKLLEFITPTQEQPDRRIPLVVLIGRDFKSKIDGLGNALRIRRFYKQFPRIYVFGVKRDGHALIIAENHHTRTFYSTDLFLLSRALREEARKNPYDYPYTDD